AALFLLFDQLGDAACVVDADWRIVTQNAGAARLFHLPADETTGTLVWQAWPPLASAELRVWLREAARRHTPMECEHCFRDREKCLHLRVPPLDSGLIIIARDVTVLVLARTRSLDGEQARREERTARLQELTAALSAALDSAAVGAAIIAYAMPALGANAGH